MEFINISGCTCIGVPDILNRGDKCTDGPRGKWCYVDNNKCEDAIAFNGMFTSTVPCKTPFSPCVCNGYTDIMGEGDSCGKFCYIEEDANCPDRTPYNSRMISKHLCMKAFSTTISSSTTEKPKGSYYSKNCLDCPIKVWLFQTF